MATYLNNTNSQLSAGWYPDAVAEVLLAQIGAGWATAEPPAAIEQDTPHLNEFERAQSAAVADGRVLTEADLHPADAPSVPVDPADPDPGDTSDPNGDTAETEGK